MSNSAKLAEVMLGLESDSDSKTKLEVEYVYYGKIVDFKELEKAASKEHQEQWEIRSAKDPSLTYFGNVRVRKSWTEHERGIVRYILTVKTLSDDKTGKAELEIETTKDMFDQVKRLATCGMVKTRHVFPIEGTDLKWEVDVFKTKDDELGTWCKIDLEVPAKDKAHEEHKFPIQLEEVLLTQPNERTEEQRAFVDRLMEEHFVQPNPFPA